MRHVSKSMVSPIKLKKNVSCSKRLAKVPISMPVNCWLRAKLAALSSRPDPWPRKIITAEYSKYKLLRKVKHSAVKFSIPPLVVKDVLDTDYPKKCAVT